MSQTKTRRPTKRQLGQFMTPMPLAVSIVEGLQVHRSTRVLEPSFGDGSFIIPLIERFLPLHEGAVSDRLDAILTNNIYGVELDPSLYQACLDKIHSRWGYLPDHHNLVCADFFRTEFPASATDNLLQQRTLFGALQTFDIIVGNPPFGGTIDLELQDRLDRKYGFRNGDKIKKETYAFFIVRCLDQLKPGGQLLFICSDTFMTIRTMRGLRRLLMEEGNVVIRELRSFSEETSYPMVLLDFTRAGRSDHVNVNGELITRSAMELTGNFSWAITESYSMYFAGPKLGDFVVCSSGMTIGKNDLFLRKIVGGEIIEPYEFVFFADPITVNKERQTARLHRLSDKVLERVSLQEQSGATRRNVRLIKKMVPQRIRLPHPDYRFYNKASSDLIYSGPTHVIFWKDDGDAVVTFKKNGNWYLHGIGGQQYFGRAGLTWQLVASRLNVRYLPEGYILDSGAPCAFLRPGIPEDELFFILGWTCTQKCTTLLKTVINHTQNIQSKDFERLPYPFWVSEADKEQAISIVYSLLKRATSGTTIHRSDDEFRTLEDIYTYTEKHIEYPSVTKDTYYVQLSFAEA